MAVDRLLRCGAQRWELATGDGYSRCYTNAMDDKWWYKIKSLAFPFLTKINKDQRSQIPIQKTNTKEKKKKKKKKKRKKQILHFFHIPSYKLHQLYKCSNLKRKVASPTV